MSMAIENTDGTVTISTRELARLRADAALRHRAPAWLTPQRRPEPSDSAGRVAALREWCEARDNGDELIASAEVEASRCPAWLLPPDAA
jgi:hypothetical protein